MHRRDLLRAFGAATALALVPEDAIAAWTRLAAGERPSRELGRTQLELIGAIADTLLPRTDSPSATDVHVPAFVELILADNFSDVDRAAFTAGLGLIDDAAKRIGNADFVALSPETREQVVASIESGDRRSEPGRTYWRLKDLIIHGYFTSEPVMKTVLRVEVMPGRFDGDVLMPARAAAAGAQRND
ncbi:MAG TPA: gluconate 2-dehydrogenase subunit 3 family protein [Gemmatimonadaceae bacterium]